MTSLARENLPQAFFYLKRCCGNIVRQGHCYTYLATVGPIACGNCTHAELFAMLILQPGSAPTEPETRKIQRHKVAFGAPAKVTQKLSFKPFWSLLSHY